MTFRYVSQREALKPSNTLPYVVSELRPLIREI